MGERRVIAQLAAFIARNAVNLANGSKHLRLFHSIHAEVGLKVEVEIQHVLGVASLLDDKSENSLFNDTIPVQFRRRAHRCSQLNIFFFDYGRLHGSGGGGCIDQVRALLKHEADHMRQRGVIAQLTAFIARDVVDLANGREHFRLLYGIDAEVRLKVQIEIKHVLGITSLLDDKGQYTLFHRIGELVPGERGCSACLYGRDM